MNNTSDILETSIYRLYLQTVVLRTKDQVPQNAQKLNNKYFPPVATRNSHSVSNTECVLGSYMQNFAIGIQVYSNVCTCGLFEFGKDGQRKGTLS